MKSYKTQLNNVLCGYSRNLLKERMNEEELPISKETLDSVSKNYSEKLMKSIEESIFNLIETDISNLKDIFNKIRMKDKEKGRTSQLDIPPNQITSLF